MISDEEKKAIETMQTIVEFGGDNFLCKEHRKQLQIILNLIEKQSKEIEEINKTLKCTQDSWFEDTQKIEEMKEGKE